MRWTLQAACAVGFALVGIALPTQATAQVEYGPWRKTNDCRPASPTSGFFRGNVRLPQAPGGGNPATECKWEREVRDCPRVRDNLRHPIRCGSRRQQAGYSLFAPRD